MVNLLQGCQIDSKLAIITSFTFGNLNYHLCRDLPPAEVVDDPAKTWRNRTTVAQYSPKFLEQVIKVRR